LDGEVKEMNWKGPPRARNPLTECRTDRMWQR
jgi:hypothetical protein